MVQQLIRVQEGRVELEYHDKRNTRYSAAELSGARFAIYVPLAPFDSAPLKSALIEGGGITYGE
jgi:hypothetical protein